MPVWTGIAFMHAIEAVSAAGMLDGVGFDGIVVSDHMIYQRHLSSPYPLPMGKPMWTRDRLARLLGAHRCDGRGHLPGDLLRSQAPGTNSPRRFGQLRSLSVPDTFDEPLPDAEIVTWEGNSTS